MKIMRKNLLFKERMRLLSLYFIEQSCRDFGLLFEEDLTRFVLMTTEKVIKQ